MYQYFSPTEKTHLKELKYNLLEHPHDYFFYRVADFDEFKQINASMWLWQWHYLSSGVSLIFETLKSLNKASCSLIALQLSVSEEPSSNPDEACSAYLAKLALSIGLLCLNVIRLATLFYASLSPTMRNVFHHSAMVLFTLSALLVGGLPAAIGVLAICFVLAITGLGLALRERAKLEDKQHKKLKKSKELYQDILDYRIISREVYDERDLVLRAIGGIHESNQRKHQVSDAQTQRFFSEPKYVSIEHQRTLEEAIKLVCDMYMLLDSYPSISVDRAKKEPGYMRELGKELMEHHAQTMLLVNKYLKYYGYDLNQRTQTSFSNKCSVKI